MYSPAKRIFVAFLVVAASAVPAKAVLTYSLEGVAGWPNQAHYDAAVAAIQAVTNRYNAYAPNGFNNYNVYVYYDAGIPTAQASWGGAIGFGGTYPAERVMQHEMAHFVGLPDWNTWSGTGSGLMAGGVWQGAIANQLIQQFEGDGAELHGDSIHFWPYGLNYDSEWSELSGQRQVALVYAMRADMGLGPIDHPSTARSVTMTASDPAGESGFNTVDRWSDGYFPHEGAGYSTNTYLMRTPESANSFTFFGDALVLNNPVEDTGLWYRGHGTAGIITFDNLVLDGGWVDHRSANGLADLFQLDGTVTVNSASTIRAYNGNINILADVTGSGDLTLPITSSARENNRYVRFLSSDDSFTGNIINQARFELAEAANFTSAIGDSGVNNAITGSSAANTLINGMFEFDLTGGRVPIWETPGQWSRPTMSPMAPRSASPASPRRTTSGATASMNSARRPAC